jgi:hypothetical protein
MSTGGIRSPHLSYVAEYDTRLPHFGILHTIERFRNNLSVEYKETA